MKKHFNLFSLLILLISAISCQTAYAVNRDSGASSEKESGNITYIDISIHQPNVEDCFATSVPGSVLEHDWINIYPNPNTGKFILELNLDQPGNPLNIHIYDIAGKIVMESSEIPEGKTFRRNIDISNFQKGLYFIRIMGINKVGVKQIIIK